jgi:hypothetical protein
MGGVAAVLLAGPFCAQAPAMPKPAATTKMEILNRSDANMSAFSRLMVSNPACHIAM